MKDIQIDLAYKNQNVRGRKALIKGQSLILFTVRNVSGQCYATSYIVSVQSLMLFWMVSLFVFSIGGPKQNVKSFLTPVSESVFYALSRGSLGFALHGSFFNHFLIG